MHDWKAVILKPDDTMEKAIQVLNNEALRVAMVADEQGRLLGTVTDGDIRRSLIRHIGLNSKVTEILFKEPTTASIHDSKDDILAMMKKKDLLQIPVLDENRKIIALETLQQLLEPKKLANPVFLMAGGFGTRLRPMTNDVPKPLLKVGNKPILETILNQFIECGFHNFFISTHYKAEQVREHFGDGMQWNVNIQYVHEEKPLGTAGALGLLPIEKLKLPVLMMNGDLLTKVDFPRLLDFHNEQDGIATMCIREYDLQVPYGVVQAEDHKVTGIFEKPIHKFFVNAGIYVLTPSLVKSVDGCNYLDMPTLLEKHIENGQRVNMFPIHEYWLDIGQKKEYEMAHEVFEEEFGK